MPEPVRTIPETAPQTEPMRRMDPGRVCPNQKTRIAERVKREVPAP